MKFDVGVCAISYVISFATVGLCVQKYGAMSAVNTASLSNVRENSLVLSSRCATGLSCLARTCGGSPVIDSLNPFRRQNPLRFPELTV